LGVGYELLRCLELGAKLPSTLQQTEISYGSEQTFGDADSDRYIALQVADVVGKEALPASLKAPVALWRSDAKTLCHQLAPGWAEGC
jgi:hypothetical protein